MKLKKVTAHPAWALIGQLGVFIALLLGIGTVIDRLSTAAPRLAAEVYPTTYVISPTGREWLDEAIRAKQDTLHDLTHHQPAAALVGSATLSVEAFDQHAKVHSSTLRKRFGNWRSALHAAGLAGRFDVTNRPRTREEIAAELLRVASLLGDEKISRRTFEDHSDIGYRAVVAAFGSWRAALESVGLQPAQTRNRSDDELLENLLRVWVFRGRAPFYGEMRERPSSVGPKSYVRRWGSWTLALAAFVENAEREPVAEPAPQPVGDECEIGTVGPRSVSLSLRYAVLRRDRFRCVLCGVSPATAIDCELHVDHIIPVSRGGLATLENLRTLCLPCNLGKGAKLETDG